MKMVRIRATRAFMDVREGDESVCPLDDWVQGLINAGHVVVTEQILEDGDDGETSAGPGSAEPDAAGGVED